jgi:hypothetical protein
MSFKIKGNKSRVWKLTPRQTEYLLKAVVADRRLDPQYLEDILTQKGWEPVYTEKKVKSKFTEEEVQEGARAPSNLEKSHVLFAVSEVMHESGVTAQDVPRAAEVAKLVRKAGVTKQRAEELAAMPLSDMLS